MSEQNSDHEPAGGQETSASHETPSAARTHPADKPSTYSQWLTSTVSTGRRDAIGALARTWKQTEGNRPRRSGIDGLTRWFTDSANLHAINERSSRPLNAGEVAEAAHAAAREYRQAQVADRGLVAGLPGTGLPGHQHAGQPGDDTGEVLSVIYGQLSRIEGNQIELLAAFREQGGKLDQVLAWQSLQDQRIAPITALLEELRAAEDEPAELADADGRTASELPAVVNEWRGGMHFAHCRDDRCAEGAMCDCPCHPWEAQQAGQVPDVISPQAEVEQALWSGGAYDAAIERGDEHLPAPADPHGHDDDQPDPDVIRGAGRLTGETYDHAAREWQQADQVSGAGVPYPPQGVAVVDAVHVTGYPASPGPEWRYVGETDQGGFLWAAPAGTKPPAGYPLPAAIENMPPGEQRDLCEAAYRAVYPEHANISQPAPQQPDPPAAGNGLYGGHER